MKFYLLAVSQPDIYAVVDGKAYFYSDFDQKWTISSVFSADFIEWDREFTPLSKQDILDAGILLPEVK